MEQLLCELDYTEAVLPPDSWQYALIKRLYFSVIAALIGGSFIFKDNLFLEISMGARILLVIGGLAIFFHGSREDRVPSSLQIKFYRDCLVLYRERRVYSRKNIRMEYDRFLYDQGLTMTYDVRNKKITISGMVHGTWYQYDKSGELKKKPYLDHQTKGFRYFYTYLDERDIIEILNQYTPFTVQIKE